MELFHTKEANLAVELIRPGNSDISNITIPENEADLLFDFTVKNGLAPWLYHVLQNNPNISSPNSLNKQLRLQYLQTLVLNQQKWEVFKKLHFLAAKNGIPILPLKGTALAFGLYPSEALRPMGDIDILVPEKKIYEFKNLLLQQGAKNIHIPISKLHDKFHAHISALTWQNIMVEPHQRLFSTGSIMNLSNKNLFEYTKPIHSNADIKIFNDIMQAYHLATHTYKGYKMGGMRLGWLLDIALLLKQNQKDPHFISKVSALNPKATKAILGPLQWASMLLPEENRFKETVLPFPQELLFRSEQNTQQRHKFIVLNEIIHTPGFGNKITMLFREFFPEINYMDHKYGKHRGVALLKLYLKRITGI